MYYGGSCAQHSTWPENANVTSVHFSSCKYFFFFSFSGK